VSIPTLSTQEKDPFKIAAVLRQAIEYINGLGNLAIGPASSTNNAAARFDGTTGALLQDSALVIADTTAALSRTGGGGIQQEGTNTNDNAAAGQVGEYVPSSVAIGSAVSITANTAVTITSISLPAGDWDARAIFWVTGNASTLVKDLYPSISLVNNTRDAGLDRSVQFNYGATGVALFAEGVASVTLPIARLSLASTTTVYLIGDADFSTSTLSGYGFISARRIR